MNIVQICDCLQFLFHSISEENANLLRTENKYLKTINFLQMDIVKKYQTPLNTPQNNPEKSDHPQNNPEILL